MPVCGGGDISLTMNMTDTPIWAFHGEADNVVQSKYSIAMIQAINSHNPLVKAKLTLFPKVKHNSWTLVYNETGMGKENPGFDKFDISIYDWMYQYVNEKDR
ncbi:MAG: hypothetical protein HC906_16745 [Bacteroidales bacterium]|nr:hypothetical protein [Bacteroidales bacterium]